MDTTASVRDDILRAVERSAKSTEKPSFSEEQLIIMAILANQKAVSAREIFDWILDVFRYHNVLARSMLWAQPYSKDMLVSQEDQNALHFRNSFDKVFWQYEVPLTMETTTEGKVLYNISSVDGLSRLAGVVGRRQPTKMFPFFELPPEIRNSIYEYMFQYPESGVTVLQTGQRGFVNSRLGDRQLGVLSRSSDDEFSFEKWRNGTTWVGMVATPHQDRLLRTRPLKEILAPLATNRQFFKEAMPLFYNLNRFYFARVDDMWAAIRSLAPSRRKYLQHVSFNFYRAGQTVCAIKKLFRLEGLRKLDIYVHRGVIETVKNVPNAPGLGTLCKLRGLEEVTIQGACENIRSRVMESLLRPKRDSPVSKKRKRGDDGPVDDHELDFE